MTRSTNLFAPLIASWRRAQLSAKLCICLTLVAVAGFGVGAFALDANLRPAFGNLEQASVERQIGRSNALLANSLISIENATKDYAVWSDSYEYIETRDPAFEEETMTDLGLINLGVNAIAYARLDGELLKARYADLVAEEGRPALGLEFGRLAVTDRVLALANNRTSFSEFILFNGRLHAFGVAQVLQSDGSGVPAGYVIMA